MVAPELKDAVWQVLESYAKKDPSMTIHSDLVIRKFPQVNEIELINALGELLNEGKITAKAATVDAHGNATAYHIRVRGIEERPGGLSEPPRGAAGGFSIGFGDTTAASSTRETEPPPGPRKVGLTIKDGKIDIRPDTGGVKEQERPPEEEGRERIKVSVGGTQEAVSAMQEEAEQNFADEVASFFAELQAYPARDDEAKKELIDQLAILMAMFQSADAASFTTSVGKLAALKLRVKQVAPDLVNDYVLLVQTGVRAWLGRV
ncbi:MAG: hypothetical protein AB1792_04300 [Candidatus Zixiibacteriota bacterium]